MKAYDEFFASDDAPPVRRPIKIGERADGQGLPLNGVPTGPAAAPTGLYGVEISRRVPKPGQTTPKKAKLTPPKGAVRTSRQTDNRDQYKALQVFFANVAAGPEPVFVGIDPGGTGGIGLLHPTDPTLSTCLDIPTTKVALKTKSRRRGKDGKRTTQYRTQYDTAEIWRWFQVILEQRQRVVVCLERTQANPGDTPLTAYAMGSGYAMWPLFLLSHDLVLEERDPGAWKRKMGLCGRDKEYSRLAAQKLFPKAPLYNVQHHNRAEAMLIAECVRRERQGK